MQRALFVAVFSIPHLGVVPRVVFGLAAPRHVVEIGLGVVIPLDLVYIGDVECAIMEGDAAGHAQSLADNVSAPVAILPADKQ